MLNNASWPALRQCALLLVLMACSLSAWSAAGIIQSVLGEAGISQRSGLERPAQKGVQLQEGDTVWTGKFSNVQIRMVDDAVIWLYPETRLKIDSYDTVAAKGHKGAHAAMQLFVGALRTVTGSIKQDYSLKMPNATIGIRGTDYTAVFIVPGAQDTRGEPGSYNRVFQGATFMESNKTSQDIAQGQAGFASLKPGAPPEILSTIPSFLNGSPTAPTPPATAPAKSPVSSAPVSPPRQLLVSVRFGAPPDDSRSVTSSSRAAADDAQEQSIQVLDGQRALMTASQGTPAQARPMPGITGAPGLSTMQFEVQPRLSGNSASVSFYAKNQVSSQGRTGPAQTLQVGTTLSVRLGEWTEVSGRGPWTSSQTSETTSSRSAAPDRRRIFLKVDDITR